jgi:integrase/recombinase XerD
MRSQLKQITSKHLNDFRDFMILKNFSIRTIKSYAQIVNQFIQWWRDTYALVPMSDDIVRKYLLHRFESGKDWQTVNSDYSAIQKFFKNTVMLRWSLKKLPRPRKEKKLPSILSREDIVKIIQAAPTFKQQVVLTFIYVTGARLSEAIDLKISDIDGDRLQVRINKGKGAKDRIILIPDCLLKLLRTYYLQERPVEYLFNGIKKGKTYSQRAVQLTMQQAKKEANIIKKGSIRTLRNCYATHHLEAGTDLVFLQEQMGHKNLKTTLRYIGLCVERKRFINHPIDQLKIEYKTA